MMMMMMSRRFDRRAALRLGALGIGGAALASCAQGTGGGESLGQPKMNVPDKYQGRKHNIVVWTPWAGANGQAITRLVTEFNDSQDEVYADQQYQGNYDETATKLTAGLQAGTAPDVTILNQVYTGQLILKGLLEPLDGYFDDELKNSFSRVFYNEWLLNGTLYKIPFARSTPLLYVNGDALEQAGLPHRGPKSWTELRDWAPELTKVKAPDGKPMKSVAFDINDWYHQAQVWEFGGQLSDGLDPLLAQDGAVEAAEWFQQSVVDEKTATTGAKEAFANGFVATQLRSTAALAGLESSSEFEVMAQFVPKQERYAVPTGGSGWAMFKGTADDRKEAAAKLIKFLASPEKSADWALSSGYIPVVDAAKDVPAYRERVKDNPNFDVARQQLKYAQPTDDIRSFVPGTKDFIIRALSKVYELNEDPRASLQEAARNIEEAAEKVMTKYQKHVG